MKNRDKWRPSKYIRRKGKLIASRDRREVGVASRLVADAVAETYDENLRHHASGKLLDLGCGKVPLYDVYKEYVTDSICVDWGNTLHQSEHLDFECDLTKELPFVDNEFNTIILSDVLEHLPQPERLWKEMSRVLSVDGKLILNVPFFYWLHERPHDYYRYTEFALRKFVDDSGLTLVQLERLGGGPEILADLMAKHFQFLPHVGAPLAICVQWIIAAFVRTKPGKRISEKSSVLFPLGYFLVAQK